jgi:hypothetical protein
MQLTDAPRTPFAGHFCAYRTLLDSIKLTRYESRYGSCVSLPSIRMKTDMRLVFAHRTAHLTWTEYVAHRTPAPPAPLINGHTTTTNGNGHAHSNGNSHITASSSSSSTTPTNGHASVAAPKKSTSPPTAEPATKKRGIGV